MASRSSQVFILVLLVALSFPSLDAASAGGNRRLLQAPSGSSFPGIPGLTAPGIPFPPLFPSPGGSSSTPSSFPNLPRFPGNGNPFLPNVPGNPSLPDNPQFGGNPTLPNAPQFGGNPSLPNAPQFPGNPTGPDAQAVTPPRAA